MGSDTFLEMTPQTTPPAKALRRLEKMTKLANLGKESELRSEFLEFHEEFFGTRQAFDQRLKTFATLTARPPLADGTPMGTRGYHLLLTLQQENRDPSTWLQGILDQLITRKKTAAVVQALEWLLAPSTPR